MDLKLRNKKFIVSGSSRGIGRGIVEMLLTEGAYCAVTGRDHISVEKTYTYFNKKFPDKLLCFVGDLNNQKELEILKKFVQQKWISVDGIVANAGAVRPVDNHNLTIDDWSWFFESNFNVAWRFAAMFTPLLTKSHGSIVFISSIAGLEDLGAPMPYAASKAAIIAYSKTLARQLASQGVRVNTIAPGNILFPGGNWDKKLKNDKTKIMQMIKSKVPLQRFGSPEDIAAMVAFLLSEKAGFITGSCFVIDGGQSVKLS